MSKVTLWYQESAEEGGSRKLLQHLQNFTLNMVGTFVAALEEATSEEDEHNCELLATGFRSAG